MIAALAGLFFSVTIVSQSVILAGRRESRRGEAAGGGFAAGNDSG